MTTEHMRWHYWALFLENSAVLPWIKRVQHLAQEAENAEEYRNALAVEERCRRNKQVMADKLWELDPSWCIGLPALVPFQPQHVALLGGETQ